ncbi:GNAT family N-acetyltransferase [Thiomicrorhabdus sp. ZW0627]|uniref:GNAT family N-acetyltransferase n=1 Tax=Thiomicrorhabdus sp. ZW0627 TaxID=3039774 RepID=UPI0024370985|nr:GNAT family N-acetyltransferase [Thiomicrorhabdus sp. ZW0627]MDG6773596.1 GNAT family N-acetyltransferase [Thiomicrorhabdus sp. ZW0627]
MLKVREVKTEDIPVLVEMVGALLDEIMSTMNQVYFKFEYEAALKQAKELIGKDKYFALIAWLEGEPVGMIAAYESYALYAQGAYGTIPECYVSSKFRGKGIGKALIDSVIKLAKQKGWHRLEVTTPPLPEFESSLHFYEQNGFEISGGKKLKLSL